MKGARSNGKWFRLMGNPPTQTTPPTPSTLGLGANASTWGDVVRRAGGGWTVGIEFEISYHKTTVYK